MKNTTRWLLGIGGALLLGAGLVGGGVVIGQRLAGSPASSVAYGPGMMAAYAADSASTYARSMMQAVDDGDDDGDGDWYPMGPGMMGGRGYGYGMMGGRGGMMWDGDEPGGYGWGMMGGAYQDEMHAAIADALGMTEEELEQAMWEEGKTPWQLADEKGISQDDLWAAMQDAHASVLAEMVADGVITQEQADWMQQHMSEGPYGPGGHCPGWQDAGPDAGTGA